MRDGMWREGGRVFENIVSNDEQTRLSNVSDNERNVVAENGEKTCHVSKKSCA
jgi:hypothetical protein